MKGRRDGGFEDKRTGLSNCDFTNKAEMLVGGVLLDPQKNNLGGTLEWRKPWGGNFGYVFQGRLKTGRREAELSSFSKCLK